MIAAGALPLQKTSQIIGSSLIYATNYSIIRHDLVTNESDIRFLPEKTQITCISGDYIGTVTGLFNKDEKVLDGRIGFIDTSSDVVITGYGQDYYILVNGEVVENRKEDEVICCVAVYKCIYCVGLCNGKIKNYNFENGKSELVCELVGHADFIKSIKITNTDQYFGANESSKNNEDKIVVISASKDKTIRIWVDYKLYNIIHAHDDSVNDVELSPFGLISCSLDKTIQIHSDSSFIIHGNIGNINSGFLAVHHFDNVIIARCMNGDFFKFEKTGDIFKQVKGFSGHFNEVMDISLLDDSFLTVSKDQTARIYDYQKEINRSQIHGYDLNCCAWINEKEYASGSEEKVIRLFKDERAVNPSLNLSNKPSNSVIAVPIENNVITESELCYQTLWTETDKLYAHSDSITCIASYGDLLVSGGVGKNTEIHLWKNNCLVKKQVAHSSTITRLLINEKYIISCSKDRSFAVWTHDLTEVFRGQHSRMVYDACVFGELIVSVGRKEVCVWKLNGEKLHEIKGEYTCICQCNDALIFGKEDGWIESFVIDDFKLIMKGKVRGHGGRVNRVAYRNGFLVSTGEDWVVRVWKNPDLFGI